ncbi:gag-polypeptide of LTR copia-type domain-containing protein [Hirsutella rhossiliensis]
MARSFVGYKEETDKIYLVWNPADKKVHEVRFVEFDESKYMDNEISQESQSQYDDEKEEKKEQGELTDDDSDAEDSVRDRTMDQEATEAGEDAGEAADGNPTDQDTADSEEELQGDTIIRSSEQSWNGGKEKNSAWQNV